MSRVQDNVAYEQEILFQGFTGLALTRGVVEEVLGSHLI
jgi:hypothetical protein